MNEKRNNLKKDLLVLINKGKNDFLLTHDILNYLSAEYPAMQQKQKDSIVSQCLTQKYKLF